MEHEGRTDEQLVEAIAAGDSSALGCLARRHQQRMLALAYRVLGRWDLAEDVVQEAFLRVWRAAAQYRPQARLTTWLHRIVINLCLDARRRAARSPAPLVDPAAGGTSPSHVSTMESRELGDRVRRAVEALPERQKMAVILHRYDGLSHREVAEATGWSESAVESLLVRAYASLRVSLADLEEDR